VQIQACQGYAGVLSGATTKVYSKGFGLTAPGFQPAGVDLPGRMRQVRKFNQRAHFKKSRPPCVNTRSRFRFPQRDRASTARQSASCLRAKLAMLCASKASSRRAKPPTGLTGSRLLSQ